MEDCPFLIFTSNQFQRTMEMIIKPPAHLIDLLHIHSILVMILLNSDVLKLWKL